MAQTREEKNARRRERRAVARAALAEMLASVEVGGDDYVDDVAVDDVAVDDVAVDDVEFGVESVEPDNDVIDYTLIEGRPIVMAVELAVPVARQSRSRKYDGSLAQRIDNALKAGGTLAEMAESLGVKKGVINACVKIRVASGKWKLNRDGDHLQMVANLSE